LLALGIAAPAPAENVANVIVPADFIVPNPCTAELVDIEGNVHFLFNVTLSANGFHLKLKGHANLQGAGGTGVPSGANYQMPGVVNFTANNLGGGPPGEVHLNLKFKLDVQVPITVRALLPHQDQEVLVLHMILLRHQAPAL
jgi:hypothetical protein